jgi:enoyl-CoA hydratase/carnithine racemase
MPFQFLEIRRNGPVEFLPRTPLKVTGIPDLTVCAGGFVSDGDVRVGVLAGAGPAFCAGADLTWMTRMAAYSHADNVRDAPAAAKMYSLIDRLPVPLIGPVIGGFLGAFAGAALFEYTREKKSGAATKAGWGAVLGRAVAAAIKMSIGVVLAVGAVFPALR